MNTWWRKPEFTTSCTRCGLSHKFGLCKAISAKCNYCQKYGHFSRCCFFKTKFSGHMIQNKHGMPSLGKPSQPLNMSNKSSDKKLKSAKQKARDQRRLTNFIERKEMIKSLPFEKVSDYELFRTIDINSVKQAKLEKCQEQVIKRSKELNAMKTDLAEKGSKIEELENQLNSARKQLKDLKYSTVEDLEKQLEATKRQLEDFKEKWDSDMDRQGEYICDLRLKLLKHIYTIGMMEKENTPQVNHIGNQGKNKHRNNAKHREVSQKAVCIRDGCIYYATRCGKCGKSMDNKFCKSCDLSATYCTICLYGDHYSVRFLEIK